MDIIEVPSHLMENFVYDARTLALFTRDTNGQSAAQNAEAMAQRFMHDRHLFGALDLETQVGVLKPHDYLWCQPNEAIKRLHLHDYES